MGKLQVRVLDAGTGRVTSARIHGVAADGRFYTPADVYARVTTTGRDFFHTEGEFTAEVYPGAMTIEAVKGFEYEPASWQVQIEEGRTTTATLELRRLTDMPARGWYSGGTHVHMSYGGNLHNTPENLAMMASAEDLHMVNALAANKDNRVFDWQYYRKDRQEYPLKKPVANVRIMFWGEEYGRRSTATCFCWGCAITSSRHSQ